MCNVYYHQTTAFSIKASEDKHLKLTKNFLGTKPDHLL